jgi:hypothetical protein
MRQIFSEIGLNLTNEQIDKYVIKYITIVWIISVMRYVKYKKIYKKIVFLFICISIIIIYIYITNNVKNCAITYPR